MLSQDEAVCCGEAGFESRRLILRMSSVVPKLELAINLSGQLNALLGGSRCDMRGEEARGERR